MVDFLWREFPVGGTAVLRLEGAFKLQNLPRNTGSAPSLEGSADEPAGDRGSR